MPGFNQTGPMGQGPMTGRRMGRCTNFGAKQSNTPSPEENNQQEDSFCRGFRFGRGQGGRGRGRGFGMQNRFRGGF